MVCGVLVKYRHLPEYHQNEAVEIDRLVRYCPSRAETMQELYGGAVYTDYEELLKNETVDLVSVCLPNALHAPVSIVF